MQTPKDFRASILPAIVRWFDAYASVDRMDTTKPKKITPARIFPYALIHVCCLGVFWVGWSAVAVWTAVLLYLIRMFAITGFYHRYFSHKSFKTDRFWQFVFAVMGNAAVQRGPLWWASFHRHHHRYVDQESDVHSPARHGFFWSHIGWLLAEANYPTRMKYVREWERFPELAWLNRYEAVVPVSLAVLLFFFGVALDAVAPELGTGGFQMLVWGFFISTTVLLHATLTINSFDHMYGTRRFDTPDTSRNNIVLALITLGEGWHNNHHHFAISARQGFYWWEIDITYYLLKIFSLFGIIYDLRPVPAHVLEQGQGREKGESLPT